MPHPSSCAPRPPASGKRVARTTTVTVLGAALIAGLLSAAPATAAEVTDAEIIAPYGGYVQDISIVEDIVSSGADTMTVAVDFCLASGDAARAGIEDIYLDTATPVGSYEDPEGNYWFEEELTIEDATGENTFRVEVLAAPLETDVPLARSTISVYPVSGPATSRGGCGTVELPTQIPPYYWGGYSPEKVLTAADRFGNQFTDTVTLTGRDLRDLDPDDAHLVADLIWSGDVEWFAFTPEGPSDAVALTLDIPGQCSDLAWTRSSAGDNSEDWRRGQTSCADGVVQASLDGGLAADERFTVEIRDTSGIEPGEQLTARTTINLNGDYDRLENTVELAEPTASFDRPWAPLAHGDLCPVSFQDKRPGGAFFASVQWLGCEGISVGQSSGGFGPKYVITRGELAAFLMRAYGEKHLDPLTARQGNPWTAPQASPFKDMKPGYPHYEAATWLHSMGIAGYADGNFKPRRPVTRQEAAQFIYLADNADQDWTAPGMSPFQDVPATHSRFEAISYLHDAGATRGYTDGTFRPTRSINRGEMAKFVETVFNN
jgi:hypothetical protein